MFHVIANFFVLTILFGSSLGCEPDEECFTEFQFAHCVSEGINYEDHEIFVEKNSSMRLCLDSCLISPQCEHASYDSVERTCFGRSRKSTDFVEDNPNAYTMPKICVPGCSIDATDFPGNDIEIKHDIKDHLDCQKTCQANPYCIASVWIQSWDSQKAHDCHLKGAMPLRNKIHKATAILMPKYCLGEFWLPRDFYQFMDNRFKFIPEKYDFAGAYYFCEDLHGKLVSLESVEKYNFIQSAVFQLNYFNFTTFSGDYQIGLRIHNNTNLRWQWVSGAYYNFDGLNIWCSDPKTKYASAFFVVENSCLQEVTLSLNKTASVICEFTECYGLEPPVVQYASKTLDENSYSYRHDTNYCRSCNTHYTFGETPSHFKGIMARGWILPWINVLFAVIKLISCCLPSEDCFPDFRFAHCVAWGSNYPFNDLFKRVDFSVDRCNQLCQTTPGCDHSTFILSNRECFGKTKKGWANTLNNWDTVTIPKICVPGCTMDAWDFPHNDIRYESAIDYLACQQLCQEEPNCLLGVWIKSWSNVDPSRCYLKSSMVMSQKSHSLTVITIPKYCLEDHRLPGNEFQYQSSKYRFIAQNNDEAEGRGICEGLNGTLVSIETKDEYLFIRSAILQLNTFNSSTFSGDYRIGLSKNSSQWTWSSGWNYDNIDFSIWCHGFPSVTGDKAILEAERSCVTSKTGSESVQNLICEFSVCQDRIPPNISYSYWELQNYSLAYRFSPHHYPVVLLSQHISSPFLSLMSGKANQELLAQFDEVAQDMRQSFKDFTKHQTEALI